MSKLTALDIERVDAVDRPATGRRFILTKASAVTAAPFEAPPTTIPAPSPAPVVAGTATTAAAASPSRQDAEKADGPAPAPAPPNVPAAITALQDAVTLHEQHMNGTVPVTGPYGDASQQRLMDLLVKALSFLTGDPVAPAADSGPGAATMAAGMAKTAAGSDTGGEDASAEASASAGTGTDGLPVMVDALARAITAALGPRFDALNEALAARGVIKAAAPASRQVAPRTEAAASDGAPRFGDGLFADVIFGQN